jgi:hypothetical protein
MLYSKKDLDFEMTYVKSLIDGIAEKTIRDRVTNLLVWYVKGAYMHRGRYLATMIVASACNAAIPVLVLLRGVDVFSVVVAVLAAVSGVTMALNSMYKWHDSWLRSRRNAEIIKNRAVLFVHGYDPYDNGPASAEQFVQDVERIVMEEGDKWFAVRSKQPDNQSVIASQ